MTTHDCRRSWEAEAARDGRLAERERVSFEAHAQRCSACSRERQRLASLAEQLRELAPETDEVSMRRFRQTIMERADSALRGSRGSRWSRPFAATAALALLGLIGVLAFDHWGNAGDAPAPLARVTGRGADALWTRSRGENIEAVHLGEGVFSVAVKRKSGDARVVVYVPEGQIEDLGTEFEVSVHSGRTAQISVAEGVVMFHRRGQPALRLSAGTVWRPGSVEAPRHDATPATPATPVSPAPPLAARPPSDVRPAPVMPPPVRPAAARRTRPCGNTGHGMHRMSGEDATYLRVLELVREGRRFEAQLTAADYLSCYPNGFRRPEIERIAQR
jgi:hypothetical protein